MTIRIDLPDEVASRLTALLPEDERDRFAVSAISDALLAREMEAEARLEEELTAELDPGLEPERDSSECQAIVEEGLEDMDAGRNLLDFEEVREKWEMEKAARRGIGRK